tara:strand:+ start:250 stop:534 length:285 start_codon:yes stop_codon:yes gene_type:complete
VKTPFDGNDNHRFFKEKVAYYWERRSPINPDSPAKDDALEVEKKYTPNFHVMHSKNNGHRHVLEREYFDRPYKRQGPEFSPMFKRRNQIKEEDR